MYLPVQDYAALGDFRYAVRKFLRFSKDVLAREKLTPEQYEALLAIKTLSGPSGITVGELSERLQVKHHTAVSLLDKLAARKLATRQRGIKDKRRVNIHLTKLGSSVLERLAAIHRREMRQRSVEMIDVLKRLQK